MSAPCSPRRGILPGGRLVLTSDHGEGFWEHGFAGHGNATYEEHLRIPLVVHGGGIAPGVRSEPVGLVDVPTTVAGLAGLPSPRAWQGRDLLAALPPRPSLAFRCAGDPEPVVVLNDGERKAVFRTEGGAPALERASPPGDEAPGRIEDWGETWIREHQDAWTAALERRLAADERSGFSDEERDLLRALGYLGDDEDP